jgi:hypothetical protein
MVGTPRRPTCPQVGFQQHDDLGQIVLRVFVLEWWQNWPRLSFGSAIMSTDELPSNQPTWQVAELMALGDKRPS